MAAVLLAPVPPKMGAIPQPLGQDNCPKRSLTVESLRSLRVCIPCIRRPPRVSVRWGKTRRKALPGEPCTENFEVPGTPFVVSFALEGGPVWMAELRPGESESAAQGGHGDKTRDRCECR